MSLHGLLLAILLVASLASAADAKPHWRGDPRTRGLAGTFLGIWMDPGTWKKAYVASDRDGVFLSRDAMETLKPVSDDLYRMLRKEGMEPILTYFGVHPARFDTLYAFFNIGPRAPRGEGLHPMPATARGEGRFLMSLDGGKSWRAIGVAVDAAWFSPDSNVILVATENAKIWRSNDGGTSFDTVADLGTWVLRKVGADAFGRQTRVHLQSVRLDPTGKMSAEWYTLLVAPGETRDSASITEGLSGRATSTDGGVNWWVQPNAGAFAGPDTMPGSVEGIPPPKMDLYYRMTPAGLQRSPDRGQNWQPLVLKPTLSSVRAMAIHPTGRASYALAETGLFRQDPESRLWVALLRPLRTMNDTVGAPVPGVVGPHPEAYGPPKRPAEEMIFRNPLALWVDREDPNHVYFCCGADGLFEIFVSGERFQARKIWDGPCADLYQDPLEPRFLYSGGIGQGTLCWSHDKGKSWKVAEQVPPGKIRFAATTVPGLPVWALVFDAERPTALLGAYASPDHGGSWKEVAQQGPFAVEELLDVAYCEGRAWAVARERWKPKLLFSDNGGYRWENVPIKPVSAFNRHTRIFCDPVYGLIGVGLEPRVVSLRASKKFADVVVASKTGRSWGSISNGLPLKGKVVDFATSQASLFMLLGDPAGENPILWEYK